MKKLKYIFIFIALLAVIKANGCQEPEDKFISQYDVVDSGAWVPSSNDKTFWLDNERVLFISHDDLTPPKSQERLVTWKPATGEIEISQRARSIICVDDGQVFIATRTEDDEPTWYRGPINDLKVHHPASSDMRFSRRFDCDWTTPNSRAAVPYKINLKGDNYLEVRKQQTVSMREQGEYGEVVYIEKKGSPPIPLPVYAEPHGSYDINFYPYKDAYFISPSNYRPNDSYFNSVWWLSREGKTSQELLLKRLPWSSPAPLDIIPLKEGYLIHYRGGGATMTSVGPRGLYYMHGDIVKTVLWGAVHGISISPDGCSAAFVYARNTQEYLAQEMPYRTVRAINFCE